MKEKNHDTYSMNADGSGELKMDLPLLVDIADFSKDCVQNSNDKMCNGIDTASNSNESGSGNEDDKCALISQSPAYLKSPQPNSTQNRASTMKYLTKLSIMNESTLDVGATAAGEHSYENNDASDVVVGAAAVVSGIIAGVYKRNANSPKRGNTTPSEVDNGAASASVASTTAESLIMGSIKGAASISNTSNFSNTINTKPKDAKQPKSCCECAACHLRLDCGECKSCRDKEIYEGFGNCEPMCTFRKCRNKRNASPKPELNTSLKQQVKRKHAHPHEDPQPPVAQQKKNGQSCHDDDTKMPIGDNSDNINWTSFGWKVTKYPSKTRAETHFITPVLGVEFRSMKRAKEVLDIIQTDVHNDEETAMNKYVQRIGIDRFRNIVRNYGRFNPKFGSDDSDETFKLLSPGQVVASTTPLTSVTKEKANLRKQSFATDDSSHACQDVVSLNKNSKCSRKKTLLVDDSMHPHKKKSNDNTCFWCEKGRSKCHVCSLNGAAPQNYSISFHSLTSISSICRLN